MSISTAKALIQLILAGFTTNSYALLHNNTGQQKPSSQRASYVSESQLRKSATTVVMPTYPAISPTAEIKGPVVVFIIVDETGSVISAQAIQGHSLLRDAALNAVRSWRFKPFDDSGAKTSVTGILTIDFEIEGGISLKREVEYYKELVIANPTSAEAYYQLGKFWYKKDHYPFAIDAYKKAISLKGEVFTVYYDLGELFYRQNEYKKAIEMYEQASKIKPDFIEAHFGKGWSQVRLRDFAEAINTFTGLVKIRDDLDIKHKAYLNIAPLYEILGRIDDAIRSYQQVVNTEQELLRADLSQALAPDVFAKKIAELYSKTGRYQEAITAYKQAVSLASNKQEEAWAYFDLATLLGTIGRTDEAIAAYKEVLARNPNYSKARLALGKLYLKNGDQESALREYEVLKSQAPPVAADLLNEINKVKIR
jgi:TonB family protein